MRRVYVARHPTEAHFLKGMLASQGIEAEIRAEALFSARGELPVTSDTCPSVWVLDDSQLDRALLLIAEYERRERPPDTLGVRGVAQVAAKSLSPNSPNAGAAARHARTTSDL